MFSGIRSFVSEHYLLLGLILFAGFILSDRYLMPEAMRSGKSEIQTFKALWHWFRGVLVKFGFIKEQ